MSSEVNDSGKTFDGWMKEVDEEVQAIAGVSVHDLADCTFYDWWQDDVEPYDAAYWALENDDFPVEDLYQ